VHNGAGIGRDQILGDEFMEAGVGGIEDRHMGKEHQQNHHERDKEKEGAPAHTGGVESQTLVEELFEEAFDEEVVFFEEGSFHGIELLE
jgi:hypothetical protein